HIFRHTTAMHLLQAGVALNIIQSWLGHVDVQTTNQYVEINMEMKRDALKSINSVTESKGLQTVIDNNRDVIGWLSSLKA
ncbi:tyrosine-type recombinase/integrase, partial [bacterium]|nr:tyrosine-type recombinase/integrase [bacterium]